jgi:hypothetical protein
MDTGLSSLPAAPDGCASIGPRSCRITRFWDRSCSTFAIVVPILMLIHPPTKEVFSIAGRNSLDRERDSPCRLGMSNDSHDRSVTVICHVTFVKAWLSYDKCC